MRKLGKVTYDDGHQAVVISPSAWPLLSLLKWLPNFAIIAGIKTTLERKGRVFNIQNYVAADEEKPRTTKEIRESSAFLRLLKDHNLSKSILFSGKSVRKELPIQTVSNPYEVAQNYENKVWIRKQFAQKIHFPEFVLVPIAELEADMFHSLATKFQSSGLVIQHPNFSGGRGTFITSSEAEMARALKVLNTHLNASDEVVVSRVLDDAQERTIQVCITDEEIFVGPPQAQLVNDKDLTSGVEGSVKFCGGRIAKDLMSVEHYEEAVIAAQLIGNSLRNAGYIGIFGLDLMICKETLYVLEVNPRLTGLTALLASLQTELPFLLLHVLMLTGARFQLDRKQDEAKLNTGFGSFVIVYAQKDCTVNFESGLYDANLHKLSNDLDFDIMPAQEDQYFVAMKREKMTTVKAGKSLAFIYSRNQLFNESGLSDTRLEKLINRIRTSY